MRVFLRTFAIAVTALLAVFGAGWVIAVAAMWMTSMIGGWMTLASLTVLYAAILASITAAFEARRTRRNGE